MASAPIEADGGEIVDTNEAGNDDAPQLTEVEQLAVEMGWDPAHKPRNGQFRSAQDWIKSTNAQNKNLRREVSDLKSNVERIVAATDRQVKREVEQRAKEIEERFAQAVEDKDTKAAAEAAQEMRDLESEQQQASRPDTSAEEQFARENPWYGTDEEATAYAVAQSQLLAKKGVSDPAEQIKQVVERVKKRFPEHFEAEEKATPTPKTLTLNNPGRTVRERTGKSFADMPAAARDAAERFYEAAKARGTAPDRKKYEENYAKDFFA